MLERYQKTPLQDKGEAAAAGRESLQLQCKSDTSERREGREEENWEWRASGSKANLRMFWPD